MVKYYDIKVLLDRISSRNNKLKNANIQDVRNSIQGLFDLNRVLVKQDQEIKRLEYKISAALKNNKGILKNSPFFMNIERESVILDDLYEQTTNTLNTVSTIMNALNQKFHNYGMKIAHFNCLFNGGLLNEDSVREELDFFLNQFSSRGESLIKTLHYQNGRKFDDVERKQQERVFTKLFNEVA